ncbi:hypothetical protein [Streptomyces sp. SGAir0957]
MAPEQWNAMFKTANKRCEKVLLTEQERKITRDFRLAEVRGKSPPRRPVVRSPETAGSL